MRLLVLLAALASAAAPPEAAVRLEDALRPSRLARRLLVSCAGVPRVEARDSGLPLAVDVRGGGRPEIVLDLARLSRLPEAEARAQHARALARAALGPAAALLEGEQASRQWTARVLAEAAAGDPVLAEALAKAGRESPTLARAAADLSLYEEDPQAFLRRVEDDEAERGAPRLGDLSGDEEAGARERLDGFWSDVPAVRAAIAGWRRAASAAAAREPRSGGAPRRGTPRRR